MRRKLALQPETHEVHLTETKTTERKTRGENNVRVPQRNQSTHDKISYNQTISKAKELGFGGLELKTQSKSSGSNEGQFPGGVEEHLKASNRKDTLHLNMENKSFYSSYHLLLFFNVCNVQRRPEDDFPGEGKLFFTVCNEHCQPVCPALTCL